MQLLMPQTFYLKLEMGVYLIILRYLLAESILLVIKLIIQKQMSIVVLLEGRRLR